MAGSCERCNKLRGSIWEIAGIAGEMLAPQEGLCSMRYSVISAGSSPGASY